MKNLLLTAGLALAMAAPAPALDDHGDWYDDFDAAVAVAKEQGKDLFVDFTGSDWCVWCFRLRDEVFVFDDFLGPAQEQFVLVSLDFPNGEEAMAAVPNPERNEELQAKYGIRGFPTCLLMNTDGVVFARMGYQEGGPEQYVADMTANAAKGKQLLIDVAKLETAYAAAEDKTPVVGQAVALLGDMDGESIGVMIVADIARQALQLDPENTTGLKLRAIEALLSSGQAGADELAAARGMDTENALGLLEQVVRSQFQGVSDESSARAAIEAIEGLLELGVFHDLGEVKNMTAMAALWCEGPLEDHERAVVLAERAQSLEGELGEFLTERLAEIMG